MLEARGVARCQLCGFACRLPASYADTGLCAFPACPSSSADAARDAAAPPPASSRGTAAAPPPGLADLLVLLYYSYVVIDDVDNALAWHRDVCRHLNLNGRVRVAPEGVNVVLDGLARDLQVRVPIGARGLIF